MWPVAVLRRSSVLWIRLGLPEPDVLEKPE